jgi:hypothetical protein
MGSSDDADLYGLPLDEFTAARNALAKELRAAGDRERATEVAALRRPTVAAWALNQLARQAPDQISTALEASDALRAAIEAAVGGDRSHVREAERAERAAVRETTDAAARLLHSVDRAPTDAVRQKITDTVKAAAQDPSVADALRAGRLSTDHRPQGFGFDADAFDSLAPTRAEPDEAAREAGRRQREERERAARARVAELDAKATNLERAAVEATQRATEARRLADEAQRDLEAPEIG